MGPKTIQYALLLFALNPIVTTWADDEYIESVDDKIYETELTKADLLKRADRCIVQTIKNDEIRLTGASTGTSGLFGVGRRQEAIVTIPSSPVVKFRDPDAGIIDLNNRIDYTADWLEHSVQTSMTLVIKDYKFKISNTEIRYLQKNVGYGSPPTYKTLPRTRFSSSLPADTVRAINDRTEKLAACLKTAPANTDW